MPKKALKKVEPTQLEIAFDYESSEIEAADEKALEVSANRIATAKDRANKTAVECALKIGKELAAAQKRLANHKNGTFVKWAQERCDISSSATYRAIQCHAVFGKYCPSVGQYFELTAMYALSTDSCPDTVLGEFKALAEDGERVTHKAVKERLKVITVDEDDEDEEEEDARVFELADLIRKKVEKFSHDELFALAAELKEILGSITRGMKQ